MWQREKAGGLPCYPWPHLPEKKRHETVPTATMQGSRLPIGLLLPSRSLLVRHGHIEQRQQRVSAFRQQRCLPRIPGHRYLRILNAACTSGQYQTEATIMRLRICTCMMISCNRYISCISRSSKRGQIFKVCASRLQLLLIHSNNISVTTYNAISDL